MTSKATLRPETQDRVHREQQLKDFIEIGVQTSGSRLPQILLIARSPESTVAAALFSLSHELASRGISARIVLAGASQPAAGETWRFTFDPEFLHETRIVRDPRFLDGHEQLVIGDSHVWFGDCMRREPDKRDAFSSYIPSDTAICGRARLTFERVWCTAEAAYSNVAEALPPAKDEAPAPAVPSPETLPPGASETLAAWCPSTRH